MMLEAVRLHNWYNSPQGQTVATLVGEVMVQWLSVNHPDIRILGLGFAQPYLDQIVRFLPKERRGRPLGASPAEMGVMAWPAGEPNRIAQVRPNALPFADEQFNQVIMAHFLEGSESPQAALRETWRILTPGGRLLTMAPNRGGLWARRDTTPFGWGRPFSPKQLTELLTESLFIPRQSRFALFMPPVAEKYFPRAAPAWEKAGTRWFAPLGGAILCEAEKVVYATTPIAKQVSALTPHARPLSQGFASRRQEGNGERSQ
ncbi:MAG: methyltransferase domain-containing protein [Magnetococcales bacterium]|nr:methyltransferase domain-containing protein [Magnetococcales bacterium]